MLMIVCHRFANLAGVTLGAQELEEQLDACLEAVELDYLLTRYALLLLLAALAARFPCCHQINRHVQLCQL